jgi:hypothetical protein
MSLSLAIALNILFDVAILGGLAYVMTRASRLAPHTSNVGARPAPLALAPPASRPRPARAGSRRTPVAA